ncbi:uncharacterized protein LOC119996741 isoform X2 [Tripterygium wilfordii]|uniref:uncharacterized protein LOC119996741 isoform X2 n=1 Tax=Tripterygium wilfordii TaxID=458696 RepID=UPI0018F840F0|nr:uncharacterized protein LOC119996741 isoform X2 [Tripterygium wilfordii]
MGLHLRPNSGIVISRTSSCSDDALFHHQPFRLVSSFILSGMVSSSKSNLTKTTVFWGWFFVLIGFVSFLGFLFTAVISKLLPASDNPLLSAIQKDSADLIIGLDEHAWWRWAF